MSKPINPLAIGGFTVGALALLVAGLLIFGGEQFFKSDKALFVIFFDSSLNGLEIGAPVKMQGVKIGSVTEIVLQIDPRTGKAVKPVIVEIDRDNFVIMNGQPFAKEMSHKEAIANRDKLVDAGFRARLETQSLLTGLLYVDLDLHPENPPMYTGFEYHGLTELPAIPTTAEEIRNIAEEMAKKLRALPLDEIVLDLAESLKEIKNLLASDDLRKSRVALAKSLEGMELTISTLNRGLEPMLKDTNKTIHDTNLLMRDTRAMVRDVHHDIKPILASTDKALSAATAALNRTQDSMAIVGDAIGPESAFNETLESFKDASRSIKELTDYLERHPESLISGKGN